MSATLNVWTIGHSDLAFARFLELLKQHGIALVVDVRSQPYSQWAHQFNRETLARDVEAKGVGYRYLGDGLGGRPEGTATGEKPDYDAMARRPEYLAGIEALLALAAEARVAILCSEGDYRQCHRHHLITQTLLQRGLGVTHIRPDGSTAAGELIARQLSLFG